MVRRAIAAAIRYPVVESDLMTVNELVHDGGKLWWLMMVKKLVSDGYIIAFNDQ